METEDNKFYYAPRSDEGTYERALIKASYLSDNMYVKLSEGFTFEMLVEQLIEQELKPL